MIVLRGQEGNVIEERTFELGLEGSVGFHRMKIAILSERNSFRKISSGRE